MCAALLALALPASAQADTFTVTSSADSGAGSLREAIGFANTLAGADTIAFAIGSGAVTISPSSALPAVAGPLTVDGTTQPGFAGDPLVQLNGTSAGAGANGLSIGAGGADSVIRGLAIVNFATAAGISVGASEATITGNWVGVDTLSAKQANGAGVTVLTGASATIGGSTAADRNVIAGNLSEGISLNADSASATILGNYVGVTPTVTRSNGVGVLVNGVAASALVGASGAPNVISGNTTGVLVASTSTATIDNNFVGLRPDGVTAAGNLGTGVSIGGGAIVAIGGTNGNVISSNGTGVQLDGEITEFANNLIGTDSSGSLARGNTTGVHLLSTGTTVGGSSAATRNVISANTIGILVAASADDTTIAGNYIGTSASGLGALGNASRGISVENGATGVTVGGILSSGQQSTLGCDGPCNVVSAAAGFGDIGISIAANATGAVIQGNAIGTRADGTLPPSPNSFANATGISVAAADATIGGFGADGVSPSARNVIAGMATTISNTTVGIDASGANLAILGNYVGVLGDGVTPASLATGVKISGIGSNRRFGDTLTGAALATATCDGACNLVSASLTDDVNISGAAVAVRGNRIGTNANGSASLGAPVAADGLQVGASQVVGGSTPGDRNLISGHAGGAGIRVNGSGVSIQGNDIGTAAGGSSGTPALRNDTGVAVDGGLNVVIGGDIPLASRGGACDDACNVISNNFTAGVLTDGTATATIAGNHIGVTRLGDAALGNTVVGVSHRSTAGVTLGGATAGHRNVISGNDGSGVETTSAGTGALTVQGNYIGPAADGTAPVPNGGAGIHVATRASIGGPGAAGNRIAENTGDGVFVAPEATGATTVLENEIVANGQLAIDLGVADEPAPGVTANDPGDVDTGGNDLQNFPSLTVATRGFGNSVQVRGAFDSVPGSYTLRVYANDACDPSGNGEAAQFVGAGTVSPGPSFSVAVPVTGVTPALGQFLTATATDSNGRTSELSPCVAVRNGVRLASASYSVNETAGTASIDVERAVGVGTETVRVDTVAGGSATAGADYTASQQVVQFDPGQTTKTAAIPILNDAVLEDLETVNLVLTNPSAGLELGSPPFRNSAVLTITSDELPSVQLASGSQQVAEGVGSATVTITRNAAFGTSTVRVRTQNGTATGPGDFGAINQVVQFAAGETSRGVSIPITQDAIDEPDEAFTVQLSEPGGAVLGTRTSTAVTIADDDLASGGGGGPGTPGGSPGAKPREPDSRLDPLPPAIAARRLKVLRGSASDPDGDLARVDVALVSVAGGARAAATRPTCLHYRRSGRITRRRAGPNRRCAPRLWLRASGSTRWRFRLPRRLPRGVWTIYARASDAGGLRETSFTSADRNRAVVRIKLR